MHTIGLSSFVNRLWFDFFRLRVRVCYSSTSIALPCLRISRERNIYFIFTFYYYHHQCNFLSSLALLPLAWLLLLLLLMMLFFHSQCMRCMNMRVRILFSELTMVVVDNNNNNKFNHNSHWQTVRFCRTWFCVMFLANTLSTASLNYRFR